MRTSKIQNGHQGAQNGQRVWKGVYSLVLGRSGQLSQNKFFDLIAPSMRKVDDGKRKKRKENNVVFVATNVIA